MCVLMVGGLLVALLLGAVELYSYVERVTGI